MIDKSSSYLCFFLLWRKMNKIIPKRNIVPSNAIKTISQLFDLS